MKPLILNDKLTIKILLSESRDLIMNDDALQTDYQIMQLHIFSGRLLASLRRFYKL